MCHARSKVAGPLAQTPCYPETMALADVVALTVYLLLSRPSNRDNTVASKGHFHLLEVAAGVAFDGLLAFLIFQMFASMILHATLFAIVGSDVERDEATTSPAMHNVGLDTAPMAGSWPVGTVDVTEVGDHPKRDEGSGKLEGDADLVSVGSVVDLEMVDVGEGLADSDEELFGVLSVSDLGGWDCFEDMVRQDLSK